MRALIQRVMRAIVEVDGEVVGSIGPGLLVFVGIHSSDAEKEAEWLAKKICALRIFDDEDGRMNRNVVEIGGSLLVVSQFTLYGDIRKGNRPSYAAAAPPNQARLLYRYFVEQCRKVPGLSVETGVFQASMSVELVNDGPVTIWCETTSTQG
jgi:D-aminoacyl-tRNA deacylase